MQRRARQPIARTGASKGAAAPSAASARTFSARATHSRWMIVRRARVAFAEQHDLRVEELGDQVALDPERDGSARSRNGDDHGSNSLQDGSVDVHGATLTYRHVVGPQTMASVPIGPVSPTGRAGFLLRL